MLGYTILLFSLPNYAITIGLSQYQASIVGAMTNLGMAVGRPIVGYYSDSVGGVNMAAGATLFGSLVCFFIWMFAETYAVLILAAILGGSVCGTFFAIIVPLASNAVGLKELPSGLSIVWASIVVPCLCEFLRDTTSSNWDFADQKSIVAEPIALSLQRHSNNWNKNIQVFAGSMFLAGAISLLFLRGLKVGRLRAADSGSNSPASGSLEKEGESGADSCVGRWLLTMFAWGNF